MNDFNYSTVLTRCMLLSAVALGLGVFFPSIPHYFVFICALVPLFWYHLRFLRPKAAEGLNQAAIDSVYYFGFLVTIGALGATALNLSFHGIGDDFTGVATQFGLGLLATGYAVWARVHLTASTRVLDEDELREIMSQQIRRSREMLNNLELAASSFEGFANTLIERTQGFSDNVQVRTQTSVDAALKAFTDGISALSEQAQIALNDLRGVVNDVTFGAEREALRASVTAMVETVASLSSGLEALKASTTAGASSVGEFAGSLERVNSAAGLAAGRLEAIGKAGGSAAVFGEALVASAGKATELNTALGSAAAGVRSFGENAAVGRDAIEAMGRKATAATGKIGKLVDALDTVGATAQAIERAGEGLVSMADQSGSVVTQMSTMEQGFGALRVTIDGLSRDLATSVAELRQAVAAGGGSVEQAVARFAVTAETAEARMKALSASLAQQANGASGASSTI